MDSLESVFYAYLNSAKAQMKMQPLYLGGTNTGGGGPPGGFLGYLPQTRVSYDNQELELYTTTSGGTLVDNLNHIRARLADLEGATVSGVGHIIQEEGSNLPNRAYLNFRGLIVTAIDDPGNDATIVTISGNIGDTFSSATSLDHSIARYNGTDNKTIQDSLATVDDSGGINIPTGQTYNINNTPHTHTITPVFKGCKLFKTIATDDQSSMTPSFTGDYNDYDTGSFHSNSVNPERITIPTTGYYHVDIYVNWAAASVGRATTRLNDHADNVLADSEEKLFDEGGGGVAYPAISQDFYFASGEWLYLTFWQMSGVSLSAYVRWSIHYLGS
jgi:hypothetical protein